MSLMAYHAMQHADVVVYDALVNPDILRWVRIGASLEYAGKRGGKPSASQRDISERLVELARTPARVLRLKGGDPFIFGRGGEEVEHLRAAGVEVHVVNGITSGLAAVTSLGVPLTHREHAHGVVFVTGHAHLGSQGTDWRALAATARDAKLTLVIYMGVSGAARIQEELLTALPASTPVAVVQRASLPDQRHAVTTLGELYTTIAREQLASPSVIVVGDVVPANVRSRRVMEKIGMTHDPDGDFDHPVLPSGHPLQRHVLYRIARPSRPRGV
jgi:uroporphyrin-III C-methyltransferase